MGWVNDKGSTPQFKEGGKVSSYDRNERKRMASRIKRQKTGEREVTQKPVKDLNPGPDPRHFLEKPKSATIQPKEDRKSKSSSDFHTFKGKGAYQTKEYKKEQLKRKSGPFYEKRKAEKAKAKEEKLEKKYGHEASKKARANLRKKAREMVAPITTPINKTKEYLKRKKLIK